MTHEEIIAKLKDWAVVTALPANEWLDFGLIMTEIESLLKINANGKAEIKRLESLEKLIWMASKAYHEK